MRRMVASLDVLSVLFLPHAFVSASTRRSSTRLRLLQEPVTVMSLLQNNSNFATFQSMITTAGLEETLTQSIVTVFAPGNDALAAVDGNYVSDLLSVSGFQQHLVNFVLHHVTDDGELSLSNLTDGLDITMRNGETVEVQQQQNLVTLVFGEGDDTGVAIVTNSDDSPSNGIVHTINSPLLPSYFYTSLLDVAGSFFRQLAETAHLASVLEQGRFTLFLPTPDAFVALPSDVLNNTDALSPLLRRHMVRGVLLSSSLVNGPLLTVSGDQILVSRGDDGTLVNGVPVIERDVLARNGIIHRVDGILNPPTSPPTMAPTIVAPDVATIVSGDSDLSTLATAVKLAGLNGTLKNQSNPITIFAPIRTAFQNLDANLVKTLFQPEWIAHLRSVVLMHVYGGSALDSNTLKLYDGSNITMLNDESTSIRIGSTGTVFITGPDGVPGTISATDYEGRNGVLHKIDTLLLPYFAEDDLINTLENSASHGGPNFSTFVAMIQSAGLEDTIRSGVFTVLAPTNDAFNDTTKLELQDPNNHANLIELVLYHLIPQVIPSDFLLNSTTYTSEYGQVVVSASCSCGIGHTFNNVPVAKADILAKNGIVYALDGIMEAGKNNATSVPSPAPFSPSPPSTSQPISSLPTTANSSNPTAIPTQTPVSPTDGTHKSNGPRYSSRPCSMLLVVVSFFSAVAFQ